MGGWESPYPLSKNPITNEGMKKGIAPNPLESFDLKNRGSFGGQQLKSYLSISMAVLFGQCHMTGLTFLLEFEMLPSIKEKKKKVSGMPS